MSPALGSACRDRASPATRRNSDALEATKQKQRSAEQVKQEQRQQMALRAEFQYKLLTDVEKIRAESKSAQQQMQAANGDQQLREWICPGFPVDTAGCGGGCSGDCGKA